MPLYMSHFAYTPEAWVSFMKNPEDRTNAVRGLTEKLGGRFVGLYYMFGEYDGFILWEFPDEVTVTAAVLAAISPGHLKATRTTVVFTGNVAMEAMRKAGTVTYRGPGQ